MKNLFVNLQLFGEGGAAAGASTGSDGGAEGAALSGQVAADQSDDLSKVIYGKSVEVAQPQEGDSTTPTTEDKKSFDDLIKKGGEYEQEFQKRTQDIINKRFKETKALESQLKSHQGIMDALAAKYGLETDDAEGILKAVNEDDSLFEEAAFKEGLSPKQYREKRALMRENAELKAAEEQAKAEQHSNEIYAGWVEESNAMVQKYGIQNFDLASEVQNPQLVGMLANGIDFETAYKAIHIDDMLGNAMATTAANVEKDLANRVASRHSRPSENGVESSNASIFRTDVNKFTDADINEIIRRVKLGEKISL